MERFLNQPNCSQLSAWKQYPATTSKRLPAAAAAAVGAALGLCARCSLTGSRRFVGVRCFALPPLAASQQPLPLPEVGGVTQRQHALRGCKALNARAAVRGSLQQQQQETQHVRVGMWQPPWNRSWELVSSQS
jgi:hypothetical protein